MKDNNDDQNFEVKLVDETQQTPRQQPNRLIQDELKSSNDEKEAMNKNNQNYDLSAAAHPFACIMTFIFKLASFLCYFFIGFVIPEVMTFIIVIILSAFDFWTVKNVTGRLLVGLRWWSDFDHQGKETWKFQSYDREFIINKVDGTFFWTSQIAGTITWGAFLFLNVLTLSIFWGLLCLINFCLCGINLYGYYKCRKQYSKKLKDLKSKWAKEGLVHIAGKMF